MKKISSNELKQNILDMLKLGMTIGEIDALCPGISVTTVRTLKKNFNDLLQDNASNYKGRDNKRIQDFLQRYIEKYGDIQDVSKAKILVEKLNDRNYPRRTRKMIQEERMERVRRLHTEQSDREEER